MKTFSAVVVFFAMLAASSAFATQYRSYEVGSQVDDQIFSPAAAKAWRFQVYSSYPFPPGLTTRYNAAGGINVVGTPTVEGRYTTGGPATNTTTGAVGTWMIVFTITRTYTEVSGSFALTESAKENKDGYVKGVTKITATINVGSHVFGPDDELSMDAGGVSFYTTMSGANFTGKKGGFLTDDSAKVSLKFSRGILTITLSQVFGDDDGEDVASSSVVAEDWLEEDSGAETDELYVTITAGNFQAELSGPCSVRISTKYNRDDEITSSSVSAKAKF